MNFPNLISLARLLAVPVTVWLLLDGRFAIAFWVFVGAGVSDAVDGYLARALNSRSALGAYLDPLADKALLVSIYVALGYTGHLPDWLVILVVFRDVMIVGGVVLMGLLNGNVAMKPLFVSKVNTVMQIVLAASVLALAGYGLVLDGLLVALMLLVAATTVLSGACYIVQMVRRPPGLEEGR